MSGYLLLPGNGDVCPSVIHAPFKPNPGIRDDITGNQVRGGLTGGVERGEAYAYGVTSLAARRVTEWLAEVRWGGGGIRIRGDITATRRVTDWLAGGRWGGYWITSQADR